MPLGLAEPRTSSPCHKGAPPCERDPAVVTDHEVIEELDADDVAGVGDLDLVRGEPFEELPVSWASEITQRVIAELQDAALELSRARRHDGDVDGAEHAARQGLRLLDPADSLYLVLAEIEKQRGHPERVRLLWQQLRQRHADDADETGGLISQPPVEIELAFRELLVDA